MKEKNSNFFKATWSTIKRAFQEFLTVPTIVIVCFLLLALFSNIIDREKIAWLQPFRLFMKRSIFSDAEATSNLLGAIASGLITVSSLTITLLLLVVQQSAASMTTQVFDQFLRSKNNQTIFGFFVGLALYALIVLATVADPFNPVIGATIAFVLTIAALFLLIILIYTTINQMRPEVIIEAIHRHILSAHKKQQLMLSKTRRTSQFESKLKLPVTVETHGYMAAINLAEIERAAKNITGDTEIIFDVSIGDYVAAHDVFAYIKANTQEDCEKLSKVVCSATEIEPQRKTSNDPADGIQQLEMIAWTSVSTAKSNPYPGLLTIRALRNLLSIWDDEIQAEIKTPFSIVYNDKVQCHIMDTLETLAVVSSESMQHQTFTEVLHSFAFLFNKLKPQDQQRIEDIILRILSVMGDFVLTAPLDAALKNLSFILKNNERYKTATAMEVAQKKLSLSVGKLNSRATRTEGNFNE